jgi:hypothetical protein
LGQQDADFMHQFQLARLERLRMSLASAASFAEDYVGWDVDLGSSMREDEDGCKKGQNALLF